MEIDNNIRDIAFEDYKNGMSSADIARKYGLKPNTVRQWANRHWKTGQPSAVEQVPKVQEAEKAIHFKVNADFYRRIKIKIATDGISLKDYIVSLITQDLEKEK